MVLTLGNVYSPLSPVAGVDEVGRGPLAGVVLAAAVIIPENAASFLSGVNDSKKISSVKRKALAELVYAHCLVGVGMADEAEILALNILGATKLAMQRAVESLPQKPASILVDGNQTFKAECEVTPIVKGDSEILEIAAASIVAKVKRDQIMQELHQQFPQYGWDKNAGYGTKQHIQALEHFGVTPYHRVGFEPIKSMVRYYEVA